MSATGRGAGILAGPHMERNEATSDSLSSVIQNIQKILEEGMEKEPYHLFSTALGLGFGLGNTLIGIFGPALEQHRNEKQELERAESGHSHAHSLLLLAAVASVAAMATGGYLLWTDHSKAKFP
jgi:hypothetical protein